MNRELYEGLLAKPFPPAALKRLNKQGTSLTYVPVAEVISRLNEVFGVGFWGYDGDAQRDPVNPDWIIGKVVLKFLPFWAEKPEWQFVTGYGGVLIKYRRDSDQPVDLGDEYKGAVSDALKKAAQALGVGLDLAREEAAMRATEPEREDPAWVIAVKGGIGHLDDARREQLKAWWKENKLPAVSEISESQALTVLSEIERLLLT